MPRTNEPNQNPPSRERREPAQTKSDVPNLGPTSDSAGRDFGVSAGYGSGGSTRDYQEAVGENPLTARRPNPLDAVIPAEQPGGEHESRQDPGAPD